LLERHSYQQKLGEKMKKITGTQIVTIFATLITIGVNAMANILPLNGLNTGEISDRFDILFVPAGYVFSIWILIYVGLGIYSIYQALPAQADNKVLKRIAPFYWLSSLANSVWIFFWHYELFSITLIAMVTILISLVLISKELLEAENQLKWLVRLPFSIYLGWISVATIANAAQTLYFFDWAGWGISQVVWTAVVLATATVLGLLKVWREKDTPYNLVLIWALVGITVSQAGTQEVVIAAWISAAILLVGLVVGFYKNKRLY
jgi:hypothetical protein